MVSTRNGLAACALATLASFAPRGARADEPAVVESPVEAPAPATRPRLTAAVGMGVTFESAGLPSQSAVPSFFASGGARDDHAVGVEALAFASSAVGRSYPLFPSGNAASPIDRLALDLYAVARPLGWAISANARPYGARVLRSLAGELGLGVERDASTVRAGSRAGLHLGARVDFPLEVALGPRELRLRLAARRMVGFYTPRIGTVDVGDGWETFAQLVSVF